ncbi:MAG: transglutaminase family protein [Verrucomicrobiota bacterium]
MSEPAAIPARARWRIRHVTRFDYAVPVRDSFNEARLQPCSNEHQTVESFDLQVRPAARVRSYPDFFANIIHHFEIPEAHADLEVVSQMLVAVHPPPGLPPDARLAPLRELAGSAKVDRCYDYLIESRFVDTSPETWRLAVDAAGDEPDAWQCARRLMSFVHRHLEYQSRSTGVHTPMRDVLASRRGVCQDFAHVLIGLCRALRIPALYVSGYLATETASATHAWTEVYIPGAGWLGLDPTHDRAPDESYVKIAVGRDYADVAPVRGTYKGTTQRTMTVDVRVERA